MRNDDVLMACLWTTPELTQKELFTLRADGTCLVYTPDGDPVELDECRLYELLHDRFAAQAITGAVAAEREACAKVADAMTHGSSGPHTCEMIAAAIRARGPAPPAQTEGK